MTEVVSAAAAATHAHMCSPPPDTPATAQMPSQHPTFFRSFVRSFSSRKGERAKGAYERYIANGGGDSQRSTDERAACFESACNERATKEDQRRGPRGLIQLPTLVKGFFLCLFALALTLSLSRSLSPVYVQLFGLRPYVHGMSSVASCWNRLHTDYVLAHWKSRRLLSRYR